MADQITEPTHMEVKNKYKSKSDIFKFRQIEMFFSAYGTICVKKKAIIQFLKFCQHSTLQKCNGAERVIENHARRY